MNTDLVSSHLDHLWSVVRCILGMNTVFDSPSLLSLLCLPFHPKKTQTALNSEGACVFTSFISKATNPRIHLFLPTVRGIRQSLVSQEVLAAPLTLSLHKYLVNLASPGDQDQTLLISNPGVKSEFYKAFNNMI